jgi:hypothetical protein
MINFEFNSVIELVKAFPTQEICIAHLEELRWNGNVVSPFDSTSKVYKCAGHKYKCKNTGKYFNVCTSTLFDNTKIELPTWFLAIYLITGHKKGISSLQLAKDLNVTQKTAWFMNHRIRNCFGLDDDGTGGDKMGGQGVIVEVDETIIGGKVKNMHNNKRKAILEDRTARTNNKTTVIGFLERGGNLKLQAVKSGDFVPDMVLNNVDTTSVLMTDTANTYSNIGQQFSYHGVVDHKKKEYGRGIHFTNSIEGCFSLLDRMILGIYHSVSAKHLQKYLNEHSFRFNSRDSREDNRLKLMLSNMENRLTYKSLING